MAAIERWRLAALQGQIPWQKAGRDLRRAEVTASLAGHTPLLPDYLIPSTPRVYSPLLSEYVIFDEKVAVASESLFSKLKPRYILAAGILFALLSMRRNQPYGDITGLADTGLAAEGRHERTDFGSGYQSDPDDRTTMRIATFAATAGGAFLLHQHLLKSQPDYGVKLYKAFHYLEENSPGRIFRTFGFGDLFSAYLPNQLRFAGSALVSPVTQLPTAMGAHIQRLTGIGTETLEKGLTLTRPRVNGEFVTGTAYLDIKEVPGISLRMARRGRMTSSSAIYEAPLTAGRAMPRPSKPGIRGWIDAFREPQQVKNLSGAATDLLGKSTKFAGERIQYQPLFAKTAGHEIESFVDTAERVAFLATERPLQNLFSTVGVGLKAGTYNKVFHIPFIGEGGIVNELLTKRILPVYLAWTGLSWLDYHLGHKPSELIASIPPRLNLLRAKATDIIPGARELTDDYANVVPGPQYGPLALPAGGAFLGAAAHWIQSIRGKFEIAGDAIRSEAFRKATTSKYIFTGALIGAALAVPFLPGMLGSRKTEAELQRVYSGEEEVPIRAGRWWEVGSTPYTGGRIKYFRPHWYATMQAQAEEKSLYGSEEEAWAHNPLIHPIRYFHDPYYLEKKNYATRPYPITSPAFSNVPLVGPILAATIGKLVKPPVYMHEGEWSPEKYTLYSPRLEPGPGGLPPAPAMPEYSAGDVARREAQAALEFIGLPGFLIQSAYNRVTLNGRPNPALLQGSRQMENVSRRYYEREIGALIGVSPEGSMYGFSEPLRRFIQPEKLGPQVNEIPNEMPSWLPGEDYFTNFKVGDIYSRIPEGFARLPGPGYEAIHPELQGINPEEYPDITKLKILADVAPYSSEYERMRSHIYHQTEDNVDLRIEYDRITQQVEEIKKSSIQFTHRRFNEEVEHLQGTVKSVDRTGVVLEEYPGRTFKLSSVGISAADISARALGDQNNLTRAQLVQEVDSRQKQLTEFMYDYMEPGSTITAVVPKGAVEHSTDISAVLVSGGVNINRAVVALGLGQSKPEEGGPESQALYSSFDRTIGSLGEALSFTGDQSFLNPMRYIPTPFHTKLWQAQTPLSRYEEEELYGTRMRRWDRPIHDFLAPYLRGVVHRLTDSAPTTGDVMLKRDLNTLVDIMKYTRAVTAGNRFQASRTNIGANLFGAPSYVKSTLPRREQLYFDEFLKETDPERRKRILQDVAPETARALEAQWVAQDAIIATAEGKKVPPIASEGRLLTKVSLDQFERAGTDLSYGDYQRSQEIAQFFANTGFNLPEPGSPAYDPQIDYEDVKVKMLMNEGRDLHDFNLYDDRAAMVWRKPYLDGAIRELTSGNNRSVEDIRRTVESLMLAHNTESKVVATGSRTNVPYNRVRMDLQEMPEEQVLKDMKRNPEDYD